MHLAIFPEKLAIAADDRGRIMIKTRSALLEKRCDDNGATFSRHRPQLLRRRPWNFLGQSKVGMIFRLAEILRAEEFRQTNNLRALLACFAHAGNRLGEIRLRLGPALHLDQRDARTLVRHFISPNPLARS
jgi:hypothetical protein